jgi:hypothetical protein
MGSSAPKWWDLEDAWGARLEKKKAAYQSATARYGRLLNATSEAHSLEEPGSAVAEAGVAAAQAVEEYTRVLRIFTPLTVHGSYEFEFTCVLSRGHLSPQFCCERDGG